MAWEPGSPEYEAWAAQNATKTGVTAPGFDRFGMPIPGPTPAAAAPGGDTPPTGTTAAQKSAKAIINSALEQYGLGSLGDRLWNDYLGGAPMEQVFLNLRQTPEYRQRFSGMEQLAKKGRAISEQQYLDLERTYSQILRQAGMPAAMFDEASDFSAWIAGEVAPTELRDRVQLASQAASQAPQEVRDELARLYGVDQGGLTAFFLAPDKALPVLTQQFTASTLGAASRRTGFGNLSREEAERLAQLGISEDAAAKGFSTLAQSGELLTALPGEAGENISRAEALGAAFEGNSEAIRKLNKRADERRAAFAGGGGFAADRSGLTGLGSAAT